jgi:hypothetical protein
MHIMVKNLNELKNRYLLWTVSELEKGKAFPQPIITGRENAQHNSTNLPFFEPFFPSFYQRPIYIDVFVKHYARAQIAHMHFVRIASAHFQ